MVSAEKTSKYINIMNLSYSRYPLKWPFFHKQNKYYYFFLETKETQNSETWKQRLSSWSNWLNDKNI